jgi:hypothetical protein
LGRLARYRHCSSGGRQAAGARKARHTESTGAREAGGRRGSTAGGKRPSGGDTVVCHNGGVVTRIGAPTTPAKHDTGKSTTPASWSCSGGLGRESR